jgi:hypothetical protein
VSVECCSRSIPPYYRKLKLSMAASWLPLARQDEAIDNLLADLDMAKNNRI